MTKYLKTYQMQKLACHSSASMFKLAEKETYLIAQLE